MNQKAIVSKKSNIKVNDIITFKEEEKLPYMVKAVNRRYAICTRHFDKKLDDSILSNKVEMQAYMTKKEAYNDLKNEVIYTVVDFKEVVRSTVDLVFNVYDFKNQKDIDTCLDDLVIGLVSLSGRNEIPLNILRVDRIQK